LFLDSQESISLFKASRKSFVPSLQEGLFNMDASVMIIVCLEALLVATLKNDWFKLIVRLEFGIKKIQTSHVIPCTDFSNVLKQN
jgi:hypothetical protein